MASTRISLRLIQQTKIKAISTESVLEAASSPIIINRATMKNSNIVLSLTRCPPISPTMLIVNLIVFRETVISSTAK